MSAEPDVGESQLLTPARGLSPFRRDAVSVSRFAFCTMYSLFTPLDFLRTFEMVVGSRHVRNLALLSLGVSVVTHRIFDKMRFLPDFMRHGYRGQMGMWALVFWYLFYHYWVIEKPVILFQRTMWNMTLMERFRVRRFFPVFYAFNYHGQTVLCNGLNFLDEWLTPFAAYRRELFPAFDGVNSAVLDVAAESDNVSPGSPICIILHGIMGSAEDNYCKNIISLCSKRGWRAAVHYRWRFDFADSRDLEVILVALQRRFPSAPLVAIGYSAGAHVLLSHLQKVGQDTPLVGAVCLSPALDLIKMMKHAQRQPRTYGPAIDFAARQCFLRHIANDKTMKPEDYLDLKEKMHRISIHELYDTFLSRQARFSGKGDPIPIDLLAARRLQYQEARGQRVPKSRSSGDFSTTHVPEEAIQSDGGDFETVDMSGQGAHLVVDDETPLDDAEFIAYYSPYGNDTTGHYSRTAADNMDKIAIPTLICLAKDDPMAPPSFVQVLRQAALTNKNVITVTTKRGGHSGWHQSYWPTGPSWADRTAVTFLASLLAAQAQTGFMLDVVRRVVLQDVYPEGQPAYTAPRSAGPGTPLRRGTTPASIPPEDDGWGVGLTDPDPSPDFSDDGLPPVPPSKLIRMFSQSDLQYPGV